jgi:WD40 repeat protein
VVTSLNGIDRFAGISAFDPVNGRLALGSIDGTVKVWEPFERLSLATIDAHDSRVTGLAFNAAGDEIISGAGDRVLRRYRWRDRALIAQREIARVSELSLITASPAEDWIAASSDFNVVLWSLSDPTRIVALEAGQGGANQLLLFSPDGRFLVAGNRVGGLTLWNIANAELAARLPNTISNRVSAAFSPDGTILVTSALDGGVYLWNLAQMTPESVNQAVLDAGTNRIHQVAWTADERLLLLFDAGGAVYLWGVGSDS